MGEQSGNEPSDGWAAAGQLGAQQQMSGDAQQQQQPIGESEEFMQVVYQSDQSGSLVGIESTLLGEPVTFGSVFHGDEQATSFIGSQPQAVEQQLVLDATGASGPLGGGGGQQPLSRTASTLPPVAEESSQSGSAASGSAYNPPAAPREGSPVRDSAAAAFASQVEVLQADEQVQIDSEVAIYSTVNRQQAPPATASTDDSLGQQATYVNLHNRPVEAVLTPPTTLLEPVDELAAIDSTPTVDEEGDDDERQGNNADQINEEIGQILLRQKQGAAESGSFRHNFRKKLGLSVSTNENDLTAHRQKLFESREAVQASQESEPLDQNQANFKRTHSVSFNVNSGRSNRHSVDIRNLPSYLTHKRASIVDVAKGAMSSLISSLGGGGGHSGASSGLSSGQRRESNAAESDDEPIFEEPIAPTLSLGQRVALVQKDGAEFGTVGWIGQLPDVDDDWIVGVLFDNKIGNCDGAYKGTRYFYARKDYAMFVPLAALTKTDNYIGRPETGTMLSRMSVSLKPGQLISIQRSSIRLQHCFLNAPHQRVGHDVRAVSNRLHCQCHNCGPCAHLTKQGNRINVLPHFGAHHLPHGKKNSLAHAAVEMLAHHHHHFHEEEEHDEKDYEFGDNAAHACNYVRYSCCQQNGVAGHSFMEDCEMVRPELLDNLIHAPKAPHRRSTLRRARKSATKQPLPIEQLEPQQVSQDQQEPSSLAGLTLQIDQVSLQPVDIQADSGGGQSTQNGTLQSSYWSSEISTEDRRDRSASSSSACSTCSSSPRRQRPSGAPDESLDISNYRPTNGVYSTIDSQISIMDQRRFIYQRDSSAFMRSQQSNNEQHEDDADSQLSGIGTRILRCFGCLRRRAQRRSSLVERPKRKLSARDRLLEYRRRQSTFVPSTLAKPHEDFASHGLLMPTSAPTNSNFNNSDYSSYSHSSNSSGSSSPSQLDELADPNQIPVNQSVDCTEQQEQGFNYQRGADRSLDCTEQQEHGFNYQHGD